MFGLIHTFLYHILTWLSLTVISPLMLANNKPEKEHLSLCHFVNL